MNILFLERDRDSRRMVKDMMRAAGGTVMEVGGIAELAGLGTAQLSLAIVEVGRDDDGLAAISFLREHGVGPPVVAIAAEPGLIEPSRAAGAEKVLLAPVAIPELFDAIERYLPAADPR